ncbi:hypothetical protein PoB_000344300 [Plakobranchus ocellatus]|uniref:Uncharacterized protein n=1 Tax=Plakobranchus ocellatus TaxID=259542 RepID=A0AAV3Y2V3_9GAST|nr:hypothetical protein PoB_000344300 [Plakobranchus ocellatus]
MDAMRDATEDTIRSTMRDNEGCKEGYIEICNRKYLRDLKGYIVENNRDTTRSTGIPAIASRPYCNIVNRYSVNNNKGFYRIDKNDIQDSSIKNTEFGWDCNDKNNIQDSSIKNTEFGWDSNDKNNIQDSSIKNTEFGWDCNDKTLYKNSIEQKETKTETNKQTNKTNKVKPYM